MKKALFISTFLTFLNSFAQNGLKNGDLFLLKDSDKSITINSFVNDTINEIQAFTISEKSIYTTDQKRRVVVLDTSKNHLSIFDVDSSRQDKLSIPFEIKPRTILLNKDNLFIGGKMGKEILVQYCLKSKKWFQLEIPKEVQIYGKAVDDLVVNDTMLIAIDNILYPKYILYYHLNPHEKQQFSHFKSLKINSTYERVHKARINQDYLGLLSTTINHGDRKEHITLYSDLDLVSSFAISIDYSTKLSFNDFLLINNKLFIANSTKGLGVLNIKESYFKSSKGEYDINAQLRENLVKYEKFKDGEIIALTRVPFQPKIILTIRNNKGKISNIIKGI